MAYLVSLMASDSCLSRDGRHLDITSLDLEQLNNFLKVINRDLKITEKKNKHVKTAYRIQFSHVALYDFLLEVGLAPNKSKTIEKLQIPDIYYADFF
jgi:hypothetical protein